MAASRFLLRIISGAAAGAACGALLVLVYWLIPSEVARQYPEWHRFVLAKMAKDFLIIGASVGGITGVAHFFAQRSISLSRVLSIVGGSAILVVICSIPFQPIKTPEYLWFAVAGAFLGGVIVLRLASSRLSISR